MEKQIEVHFNECLNALAARKDLLLRDLAEKANTQGKMVEKARTEIQQTIKAQRDILMTGETVFKLDRKTAEHVWKGVLSMNSPQGIVGNIKLDLPDSLSKAIQDHGKVFVGENPAPKNSAITEIDFSNPKVVPFAGSYEGFQDGKAAQAKFRTPRGICWSTTSNCFFVCDQGNNAIRKVTLQGEVSTFALGGLLKLPHGIAIHQMSNDLFITNGGEARNILKITSAGSISVIAGPDQEGCFDGSGLEALFSNPIGITIDQQTGNLFVSDYGSHLIRKITPQGEVSTLAGSTVGHKDGKAATAQFNGPWGICFCASDQSLLVCDSGNNKLRRVLLNGEVTTVCNVPTPSSVFETQNSFLVSSIYTGKIFTIQGKKVIEQNITERQYPNRIVQRGSYPNGIVLQGSSCYVVDNSDNQIVQINYSK